MIALWIGVAASAVGWLLPIPTDKLGWGLRVRPLEYHQPYLAREYIEQHRLTVVLINQSKEERKYLLLDLAGKSGDLKTTIIQPSGNPLRSHFHATLAILFEERWKLPAGQLVSDAFKFQDFGYHVLPEPGEYELRASFKTPEGVIVSPAVKLTVIEPSPEAILASQPVPLEGYQAKWPKDKQERAVIQQIKIGNRTWLVYRRFLSSKSGGKVSNTFRLAELPEKVEMKVEGAYGARKPLTITYKDENSPTGTTKLVINAIDGTPWDGHDKPPTSKQEGIPPPRAVKP